MSLLCFYFIKLNWVYYLLLKFEVICFWGYLGLLYWSFWSDLKLLSWSDLKYYGNIISFFPFEVMFLGLFGVIILKFLKCFVFEVICFFIKLSLLFIVEVFEVWSDLFLGLSDIIWTYLGLLYWSFWSDLKYYGNIISFFQIIKVWSDLFLRLFGVIILKFLKWFVFIYSGSLKWFVFGGIWDYLDLFGVIILKFLKWFEVIILKWFEVLWKYYLFFPIWSDVFGLIWGYLGVFGVIILKFLKWFVFGGIWDYLGLIGGIWDYLDLLYWSNLKYYGNITCFFPFEVMFLDLFGIILGYLGLLYWSFWSDLFLGVFEIIWTYLGVFGVIILKLFEILWKYYMFFPILYEFVNVL